MSVPLLIPVQVGEMLHDEGMGREEEASRATGRIADRLARLRADHIHDRLDERPRREVLAGAALGVLGVLI